MRRNLFFVLLSILICSTSTITKAQGYVRPHDEVQPKPTVDVPIETGVFSATEESLSGWECPDWFRNAKFGMWAHWGPQCQAEWGDWYARGMYIQGNGQYNHHVATYGSPSNYGLKELCRDFTAPDWDPESLIKLYKDAGAQFFMALGNHHDNFDLWDSPYQEWNSMNIGPGKDILGGWSEACKKYGLPLGVSIHASHAWSWLEPSQDFDGNLTKEEGIGKWWEGYDPQELYTQRHSREPNDGLHWDWDGTSKPDKATMMKLQNRVLQCINAYNPDMIYFDDSVLPFWYYNNQIGLNILQHFYNHSANQHDGKQQVVATGKILSDSHKKFMLWDVERGIPDRAQAEPWQTCTCIGSWHYDVNVYNNNGYKSAGHVIRMLVDVVSKNGCLLLSIPVNRRGVIDNKERAIVMDIKAWMDINKESIYDTRPWTVCGEGPLYDSANPLNAQGFNENINYSNEDVRYNEKESDVYATIMKWPDNKSFTFKAFSIASESYSGNVKSVELLGYGAVAFSLNAEGLTVEVPETHPNEIAPVFKITVDGSHDAYSDLQQLINMTDAAVNVPSMIGINTGKYSPESVAKMNSAIDDARSIGESATDEEKESALHTLREAYKDFLENGKVPGGNLGTYGTNITTKQLVEGNNFSRSDGKTTRFGTPTNWAVENFSIPQTNSNGTKNGIDNYPGINCLMLGVWASEDGNTSSDLTKSRIYRKVNLPAGTYFFGATYNTLCQLSNSAYIFATETLGETDDLPVQSLAYYPLNKCASDGLFYGIEFTLDSEKEIYLGWQMDLTKGSNTQEIRVLSVRLVNREESFDILQDGSQPKASGYLDLTVGELVEAASPFQAKNMGSRYGAPTNWTVENYSISSGSGTRNGIDNYPGYNCLSIGIWGDLGNNKGDSKNARIYRQVHLTPGMYYWGAKYETRYNLNNAAYLFASTELLNTSDIPEQSLACHPISDITSYGNDSQTWYGVVFKVTGEQDVYIGWQADLTQGGDNQEFRAKAVTLLRYDNFEDLTTEKLVEESEFSTTEMGGRYGTPANWTVEGYSISSGSGTRNGIDNYPGYNCLSIGIWGDRGSNVGDGGNARIYRKVQLEAGTYYFGSAYQTVYNMNDNAYIFASTELVNTNALSNSNSTLACKQVNSIPHFATDSRNEIYYITFELTQPQEVYLGWQADITKGSVNQEFRAKNVKLCRLSSQNEPTTIQTLTTHTTQGNKIYNLCGQTVDVPARGIYIINGKKMLITKQRF